MLWWYFLKDGGYVSSFLVQNTIVFSIKTRNITQDDDKNVAEETAHINTFLSSGSTRPPHFSLKYFVRHLILGSSWAPKKRIGALISRYIHMTWKIGREKALSKIVRSPQCGILTIFLYPSFYVKLQ